jgi:tryptophan synthase beta chain
MTSLLKPGEAEALLAAAIRGELPDERGRFGPFGGRYVPETLVPAFERLEAGVKEHLHEPKFQAEFQRELREWVGRPTALTHAPRLSERWGADVWLKREDLAHTGAHKINNAIGQALLAKRLGVERVIAETGAGQHGVASAAACARVGLPCAVYMGAVDIERQAPNVDRMRRLGAEVVAVESGDKTLRAAIDEALRKWVTDPAGIYYLLGSAVGAHPYPYLVRELQSVIGRESREQMIAQAGGLPDAAFACVGGGSNAIGLFHAFLGDAAVKMVGVEAGGRSTRPGDHAARFLPEAGAGAGVGVLQGTRTYLLQDPAGNVLPTHSVSAGLDYPAVGPEHASWRESGRVVYTHVGDDEAVDAFHLLSESEGIVPALESAHAVAYAVRVAPSMPLSSDILVNLSGRGDKDLAEVARAERDVT